MNSVQSDVINARAALIRHYDIHPDNVYCGWHEGRISLLIHCPPEQAKSVLDALGHTAINLPIVIKEGQAIRW